MISLQITDLKSFMGKLLTGTVFDSFQLTEAVITTYHTFSIDGRTMQDFYSAEEKEENPSLSEEFSSWSKLRPLCLELMKGKRTPLYFKLVFHLSPKEVALLLSSNDTSVTTNDIKAFVLTLKYNGSTLLCTTGTDYHTFLLDKSADALWDFQLLTFFKSASIDYDKLL